MSNKQAFILRTTGALTFGWTIADICKGTAPIFEAVLCGAAFVIMLIGVFAPRID